MGEPLDAFLGVFDEKEESVFTKKRLGLLGLASPSEMAPQANTLLPSLAEEDNNGLFMNIGGVPTPFMQLGTFLGMPAVPALVVDMFTDVPGNVLLGGTGNFLKAARAGSKTFRAGKRMEQIFADIARIRGLSPEDGVNMFQKTIRAATAVDARPYKNAISLVRANKLDELLMPIRVSKRQLIENPDLIPFGGALPGKQATRKVNNLVRAGKKDEAIEFLRGEMKKRFDVQTRMQKAARSKNTSKQELDRLKKDFDALEPSAQFPIFNSQPNRKVLRDTIKSFQANSRVSARNARGLIQQRVSGLADPQKGAFKLQVPFTDLDDVLRTSRVAGGETPIKALRQTSSSSFDEISREFPGATEGSAVLKEMARNPDGLGTASDLISRGDLWVRMLNDTPQLDSQKAVRDVFTNFFSMREAGKVLAGSYVETLRSIALGQSVKGRGLIQAGERRVLAPLKTGQRKTADEAIEVAGMVLDEPGRYVTLKNSDSLFTSGTITARGKAVGVTPAILQVAEVERAIFREVGDRLNAAGLIDDVWEQYFPRSVKKVKGREIEFDNWHQNTMSTIRGTKFKHGENRVFTYRRQLRELEAQGVIKLKSATETTKEYIQLSVERMEKARTLRKMAEANVVVNQPIAEGADLGLAALRPMTDGDVVQAGREVLGEFGLSGNKLGPQLMRTAIDQGPQAATREFRKVLRSGEMLGAPYRNDKEIAKLAKRFRDQTKDQLQILRQEGFQISDNTLDAWGLKTRKAERRAAIKEYSNDVGQIELPRIVEIGGREATAFPEFYTPVRTRAVKSLGEHLSVLPHRRIKNAKNGLAVYKDDARILQRMTDDFIGEQDPAPFFDAMVKVNALAKRSLLFVSAFHMQALTENGVATFGAKYFTSPSAVAGAAAGGVAGAIGSEGDTGTTIGSALLGGLVGAPVSFIRRGQRDFFESVPMMEVMLRSGLGLGSMVDFEVDATKSLLQKEGKVLAASKAFGRRTGIAQAMGHIAKGVGVWDRFLWDYWHAGMKMAAWSTMYERGLMRFSNKDPMTIAKGISSHVNKAFGGHIWENLMFNKKMQGWARLLVLAPDWTASNLLIASDFFTNTFHKTEMWQKFRRMATFPTSPQRLLQNDVQAHFARRYAFNSLMAWYAHMNMTNFAFSGHFMFDNPEGRQFALEMPFRDHNGRRQFAQVGKQFMEPIELVSLASGDHRAGLFSALRRKASQAVRISTSQMFGKDLSTGMPIVLPEDGPTAAIAKRGLHFLGAVMPINAQEALDIDRYRNFFSGGAPREPRGAGQRALGAAGFRLRGELNPTPSFGIPSVFSDVTSDASFRKDFRALREDLLGTQLNRVPVAQF